METPIILVFYIEVGSLDAADISAYIDAVRASVQKQENEGTQTSTFIQYFVPTRGEPHSRIECINPTVVGQDEYAKVANAMSKMEAAMADIAKERAAPEEPELPPSHSDR